MPLFVETKILFVVHHIANMSWPLVLDDIEWYQANGLNKKLWLDQVGFPAWKKISSNVQLGCRMVGHPLHMMASNLIAHMQSLIYRMNM